MFTRRRRCPATLQLRQFCEFLGIRLTRISALISNNSQDYNFTLLLPYASCDCRRQVLVSELISAERRCHACLQYSQPMHLFSLACFTVYSTDQIFILPIIIVCLGDWRALLAIRETCPLSRSFACLVGYFQQHVLLKKTRNSYENSSTAWTMKHPEQRPSDQEKQPQYPSVDDNLLSERRLNIVHEVCSGDF